MKEPITYKLTEVKDTAKKLLLMSKGIKTFAFTGDLGAGKTTLVKAVCEELGVTDLVSSPTFSIINEYLTSDKKMVYHLDLYRLEDDNEALGIGIEDYLYSNNFIFIEGDYRASSSRRQLKDSYPKYRRFDKENVIFVKQC